MSDKQVQAARRQSRKEEDWPWKAASWYSLIALRSTKFSVKNENLMLEEDS